MIDLQPFCADEDEASYIVALEAPFSDDNYTYGCDGRIAVRVPKRADVTATGPDVAKIFRTTPEGVCVRLPDVDLGPQPQAHDEDCKSCKGLGYAARCPDCLGQGETECNSCGHDCECEKCDGNGVLDVPMKDDGTPSILKHDGDAIECDDCEGEGKIEVEPQTVRVEVAPGLHFADRLLRKLFLLPNVRMDLRPYDGNGHYFVFDGGDGILMPMRPQTIIEFNEPVIHPKTREVA